MKSADVLKQAYARRLTPDPDGGFTATIQEFPGLVAEGETAEEALQNLELAAASWIESVVQTGHEVPPPIDLGGYSGKIALRLPRGLHKRAAEMASAEGVSLNQWLVSSVAHYLGTQEALHIAVNNICARMLPWANVGSGHTVFLYENTLNLYLSDSATTVASGPVATGSLQLSNADVMRRGLQWLTPHNTYSVTKS